MKLTNSEKSSLILVIADLLSDATVSVSSRVNFNKEQIQKNSIKEKIGEDLDIKISDVCGEQGLIDFLRFQIMREIIGTPLKKTRTPLKIIPGYGDALEVARSLVSKLEALPSKFRIVSPLPPSYSGFLFNDLDSVSLGDGVSIERADKIWASIDMSFSSEKLENMILRNVNPADFPKKSTHCICTWHSGFAGAFTGNSSIQSHQDTVRSLHGSMLALGIVEEDYFFDTLSQFSVLATDITSVPVGKLVLAANVDTDLSMFYKNFDVTLDYYQSSKTEEADAENEISSSDQMSWDKLSEDDDKLRNGFLKNIRSVFAKDDNARKLRTSALWLFRSFVSSRSLDVILESTISLEVLLGDRNESSGIGLTKLLANRCAYLLGSSAKERSAVMEQFKLIYEMRSGIVHGGLHQMDTKATNTSLSARELAGRVLRKEISLASK